MQDRARSSQIRRDHRSLRGRVPHWPPLSRPLPIFLLRLKIVCQIRPLACAVVVDAYLKGSFRTLDSNVGDQKRFFLCFCIIHPTLRVRSVFACELHSSVVSRGLACSTYQTFCKQSGGQVQTSAFSPSLATSMHQSGWFRDYTYSPRSPNSIVVIVTNGLGRCCRCSVVANNRPTASLVGALWNFELAHANQPARNSKMY